MQKLTTNFFVPFKTAHTLCKQASKQALILNKCLLLPDRKSAVRKIPYNPFFSPSRREVHARTPAAFAFPQTSPGEPAA